MFTNNVPTNQEIVEMVLHHDRRRIRFLTFLSCFLWLLTAVAVGILLYSFFYSMLPHYAKSQTILKEMRDQKVNVDTWGKQPPNPDQLRLLDTSLIQAIERTLTEQIAMSYGVAALTGTVGILGLALLCSLINLTVQRRATLRQIQLSLRQIQDQFIAMQVKT